jgi:hypothetical protein
VADPAAAPALPTQARPLLAADAIREIRKGRK